MSFVEPQTSDRRKLLSVNRAYFLSRKPARLESVLPASIFVTDPNRTPDPVSIARQLPQGSGILYRHFGKNDRFTIGEELKIIARKNRLKLIISYDPKLADFIQPDGVHWPKKYIRHFLQHKRFYKLNTCSAHSFRQISNAGKLNFDACFVSAVFPSRSPSAPNAMGPAKLRFLCQESQIPIYGLGGLNPKNAHAIIKHAGYAGVDGFT